MQYTIFDIETNGLLDNVSKIHCLSYQKFENGLLTEKNSITNYEEIKNFIQTQSILIGHNIIRYDLPVLKKLLGAVVPKETKIIDTLGLSWYLYESRKYHGLEEWGEDLGVEKPKIEDWSNLSIKEYIYRCNEDVEINQLLFHKQLELLIKLYNNDYWRIINYLNFKLHCLLVQETTKCKIDVDLLNKSLNELTKLADSKIEILKSVMPKNITYKTISKPSKLYKKDGSLSSAGEKWFNLLLTERLPEDYEGEVSIINKIEDGNPASISQLKSWLFSLGWKPDIYAEVKDKKADTIRQVEQIFNDKKLLTDSVKELISICPELEELNQLSLINHRIGIFKSFRNCLDKDNCVIATAGGLSNTNRFKHRRPISNLPKPGTFYGEQIRGLIINPISGTTLCGSDLSAAEATTQDNYMFKFDPQYVKDRRTPGFDPHLDIGILAGLITQEEADFFKNFKEGDDENLYKEIKKKRSVAKTINFCLPTDNTEILTIEGWKNYSQLSLNDKIFSYNTETDELEVVDIESIPFFSNQEVLKISNHTFSFECTPNHKWFSNKRVRLNNGITYFKQHFVETIDIKTDDNIVVSSYYKNQNNKYNINDIRLLAWILTEGYIKWSDKLGGTSNSFGKKRDVICTIGQKDNKENLEEVLSNFEYRSYQRKDGLIYYNVLSKEIRGLFERLNLPQLNKKEIDYTNLIIGLSYELREEFIIHMLKGDGYNKSIQKVFTQNKGNILNAFCLALTLNGYFYNLSKGRTYKDNTCVDVYVRNRRHITGQKLNKTFSRYTDVFCVNNRNKTFIAKQNDKVVITGNSSTYGSGVDKKAKLLNSTREFAEKLHNTYWERNKSLKDVANDRLVKVILNSGESLIYKSKNLNDLGFKEQNTFLSNVDTMWLLNPISKFWQPLRYFKDIFSTLNQSTAVYVFDCYLKEVLKYFDNIMLQVHDEFLMYFNSTLYSQEDVLKILKECISIVNKKLKLPIPLDISADFGTNYAQCH